jgi:hypothetical protein
MKIIFLNGDSTSKKSTICDDCKTKYLMISSKIIAVYSEMHAELINILCGENRKSFNVNSNQ